MKLFEIDTGREGCSYERCYVWAKDADEATRMFRREHPLEKIVSGAELFDQDSEPFITKLSDEGFEK